MGNTYEDNAKVFKALSDSNRLLILESRNYSYKRR